MASVNLGCVWKRNVFGATAPFKFPVNFQAGATQLIKSGDILDLSGSVAPLASDKSMAGIIAVSDCEIRSGDLGGYRDAIVPRPGDMFEFALSASAVPTIAEALYWSTSQVLAVSGSNIIGYITDVSFIPLQGFNSVNPSFDVGTTLRTVSNVLMSFKQSVSYYAALYI